MLGPLRGVRWIGGLPVLLLNELARVGRLLLVPDNLVHYFEFVSLLVGALGRLGNWWGLLLDYVVDPLDLLDVVLVDLMSRRWNLLRMRQMLGKEVVLVRWLLRHPNLRGSFYLI